MAELKAEINKSKGYATESQRFILSGNLLHFPYLLCSLLFTAGRALSDSDTFEAIGLSDGGKLILMMTKVDHKPPIYCIKS
jgi:hypothetical protein